MSFKSRYGKRNRPKVKKKMSGALNALISVYEQPNVVNEGDTQYLKFPAIVDLKAILIGDEEYKTGDFSLVEPLGKAYQFEMDKTENIFKTEKMVYGGFVWNIKPPAKPGDLYEAAYEGFKNFKKPEKREESIPVTETGNLEGIVRIEEVRAGDLVCEEGVHYKLPDLGRAGGQVLLYDDEDGPTFYLQNVYNGFEMLRDVGSDRLNVKYTYTDPNDLQ
ncbi:MAG: hypothetical protein R6V53_00470 [Candidatus Woesearchaeota archaeon]